MQIWKWTQACAVAVLLFVVAAATHATGPKRIAVVIGNAKYANVKPLANPHLDAALIGRVARQSLGFTEVLELRDLSRKQMFDLLDEVRAKSQGADAVMVYFSGHGMRGAGGNYMIPVDADIQSDTHLKRDAVPVSEWIDLLKDAAPRVGLLVLDACRDNPYAIRTRSTAKGLARMQVAGGNLLVAYATGEGQVADDGSVGQNSPFAKALADQLQQAHRPLLVQLDSVRRQVIQITQSRQSPTREGDLEADVLLLPEKAVVPPAAKPVALQPCDGIETKEGYWQCRWAAFRNAGDDCQAGLNRVMGLVRAGNTDAMVWLAQRHQPGDQDIGGECLPRSDQTSDLWWQRAAQAGDHYARCELAKRRMATSVQAAAEEFGRIGKCMNVSVYGLDFLKAGDAESAYRMALVSTKDGDRQGMNLLGYLLERGAGGASKDTSRARELYRQSAELGHADGSYNYGIALLTGLGGPIDRTAAVAWLEKAAAQGHPSAVKTLASLR